MTEAIMLDKSAIQLEAIVKQLPELEVAWEIKHNAGEKFKELCKAVAESSRVDNSVIAAYVNAVCTDKLEEVKAKAEQLSLLFEEIK